MNQACSLSNSIIVIICVPLIDQLTEPSTNAMAVGTSALLGIWEWSRATFVGGAFLVTMSLSAYGQGQFAFNNRAAPDVDARVVLSTDLPGTSSAAGSAYSWQLEGGPEGVTLENATILATGVFRTGGAAGYVEPPIGAITVPNAPYYSRAEVYFSIFQGPTPNGKSVADFGPHGVGLASPGGAPPSLLPLGTSPLVVPVPEPSEITLTSFGLSGLLLLYQCSMQRGRPLRKSVVRH
jgi:hypothetical protein